FNGVNLYAADGHAIAYTVSEDAIEGYTSEITGDMVNGFTITNTETPVTPTPEKPGKKRKHRTPDTGDVGVVAMVAFATVGAGFVGVGAYARTRKDQ
ncbi:MAG: Cna B-type domain-containing protein, partial [Atopobium sp.]|nr:Cna B-type domain-containing protein [Atopobium sp.]